MYAYSSPETLIYIFMLLFLYFIYNIYSSVLFSFYAFESLFFVYVYLSSTCLIRVFLSINFLYIMNMHSHVQQLVHRCWDAVRLGMDSYVHVSLDGHVCVLIS